MNLRLAPSSPARMAAQLDELRYRISEEERYEQDDDMISLEVAARKELRFRRSSRLLLRWYAAGVELSWECPYQLMPGEYTAGEEQMYVAWYGEAWANRYDYQRLPDDWRARLRKELGE